MVRTGTMGFSKFSAISWTLGVLASLCNIATLTHARIALDPATLNSLGVRTTTGPELGGRTSSSLLLNPTCKLIQSSVSNASAVFAPGTAEYAVDIRTSYFSLRYNIQGYRSDS